MRCQRIMMSSSETNSVCPLCRPPVTFGGGMVMTNGLRCPKLGCDSGRKSPCFSQNSYQWASISAGLYGAYVSVLVTVAGSQKQNDPAVARTSGADRGTTLHSSLLGEALWAAVSGGTRLRLLAVQRSGSRVTFS